MNEQNYQPQQPPVQQQPVQQQQQPQQQYQPYGQPVQQPYAPQYQQPAYADPTTEVMSIGSYLGVFFISMIPVVNLICIIVWLASSNTNKNKKNYIIASIIFSLIIGVIYGLLVFLLITLGVVSSGELAHFFNI